MSSTTATSNPAGASLQQDSKQRKTIVSKILKRSMSMDPKAPSVGPLVPTNNETTNIELSTTESGKNIR